VNISTSSGETVVVDAAVGADRALRFLALLQPGSRDSSGDAQSKRGVSAEPAPKRVAVAGRGEAS
jgi:hypothetical protein